MLSNMHSMDIVAKNTIFVAPSKSCLVSGSSVGYHLCLQCRIPTVQYVQSVLDTHSAEHFFKIRLFQLTDAINSSFAKLSYQQWEMWGALHWKYSSGAGAAQTGWFMLFRNEQTTELRSWHHTTTRTTAYSTQNGMGSDRTRGYGYEVNIGTCHMLQMQRRIFDLWHLVNTVTRALPERFRSGVMVTKL